MCERASTQPRFGVVAGAGQSEGQVHRAVVCAGTQLHAHGETGTAILGIGTGASAFPAMTG